MLDMCHYGEALGDVCFVYSKVKDQIPASFAAAIVGSLLTAFGGFFSLWKPKTWRMAGRWHRYGVSFYPTKGVHAVHSAVMFIVPLPPLLVALSINKTYSYIGSVKLADMLYISWKGLFHSEKMLSIFEEPLVVNKDTMIIGIKSCITKYRQPAANKEILSKTPLEVCEIQSLIGDDASRIVVIAGNRLQADYER